MHFAGLANWDSGTHICVVPFLPTHLLLRPRAERAGATSPTMDPLAVPPPVQASPNGGPSQRELRATAQALHPAASTPSASGSSSGGPSSLEIHPTVGARLASDAHDQQSSRAAARPGGSCGRRSSRDDTTAGLGVLTGRKKGRVCCTTSSTGEESLWVTDHFIVGNLNW
jgi:hypothetical protein